MTQAELKIMQKTNRINLLMSRNGSANGNIVRKLQREINILKTRS